MKLKGTVQRDFRPPDFSSFKPTWATDLLVKIFLILVKISLSYSNFSKSLLYDTRPPASQSPLGILSTISYIHCFFLIHKSNDSFLFCAKK